MAIFSISTAELPPLEITAVDRELATPTYEEAMQYFREGQLERAATAFQSIVREQPGRFDARYGLAESARKLGAFDVAMSEFERLAADPIYAVRAQEGIALINLRIGQILLAKIAAGRISWVHLADVPLVVVGIQHLVELRLQCLGGLDGGLIF